MGVSGQTYHVDDFGHITIVLQDDQMVFLAGTYYIKSLADNPPVPAYFSRFIVAGESNRNWEHHEPGGAWTLIDTIYPYDDDRYIPPANVKEVVKNRNRTTFSVSLGGGTPAIAVGYVGNIYTRAETSYKSEDGIEIYYRDGRFGMGGLDGSDASLTASGSFDCAKWHACFVADEDECAHYADPGMGDPGCITHRAIGSLIEDPRSNSCADVYISSADGFIIHMYPVQFPAEAGDYSYEFGLFAKSFGFYAAPDDLHGKIAVTKCNSDYVSCWWEPGCGLEAGDSYLGYYNVGTDVSVSAIPTDECYEFDKWRFVAGAMSSPPASLYANPFKFTVPTGSCDEGTIWPPELFELYAIFKLKTIRVGTHVVEGEGDADVEYGGSQSAFLDVQCGSSVNFIADPDHCYRLLKWVIDGVEYRNNSVYDIIITKETTAYAYFKKRRKKTEGDQLNYDSRHNRIIYGCNGMPIFGKCKFLTEEEERELD